MVYALLVVDYQNDFVTGSLGSKEAKAIENNIVSKIEGCLASGGHLFFTMDTHNDDYLNTDEGRHIPISHCIKGTSGWELHGKVAEYERSGTIIEKETFGSLPLVNILKGYDEIEICGVVTDICVIANAVILKTAFPDTRVIVDPSCVASNDADMHMKALDIMRSLTIDVIGQE